MDSTDVLWDRLAGGLQIYVENYYLKITGGGKLKLQPSYNVDYVIEDIDLLKKHNEINDYWVFKIGGCRNINELPVFLRKLVVQFLPRFFQEYPQYRDVECLKINS